MKKIIFIYSIIFFSASFSCTGQKADEKRRFGAELTTFEQKQKEAARQDENRNEDVQEPAPRVAAGLDFRDAARKATPGVVHIRSIATPEERRDPYRNIPPQLREFFNLPEGPPAPMEGAGSGVIISDDGYIVTNNHVISRANEISVTLYDNRTFTADVIGSDPTTDLALLKIDGKNLPFVEFGDMENVEVGEWVLAVGNPFNLSSTVTAGIISATSRNLNILQEQAAVESFIQTDAAVNPGNSGGALVDLEGKLVGINTAIASPTGTYSGYAFAVPVDLTRKVVNDLLNYGIVQRGYLGVMIRNVDSQLAEEENLEVTRGAYVDSMVENGAAEDAGLREGDVIVEIDDQEIISSPQLQSVIAQKRPGDEVRITVMRDGNRRSFDAVLRNERGGTDVITESAGK